jgi:hypothetical protein
LDWPYKNFSTAVSAYFLPALVSLCTSNDFFYEVPKQHKHIISGGSDPLSSILSVQQFTITRSFRMRYNLIFKSQFIEPMTNSPLSWASFCHLENFRIVKKPSQWNSILSWLFPTITTSSVLSFPCRSISNQEFFAVNPAIL